MERAVFEAMLRSENAQSMLQEITMSSSSLLSNATNGIDQKMSTERNNMLSAAKASANGQIAAAVLGVVGSIVGVVVMGGASIGLVSSLGSALQGGLSIGNGITGIINGSLEQQVKQSQGEESIFGGETKEVQGALQSLGSSFESASSSNRQIAQNLYAGISAYAQAEQKS